MSKLIEKLRRREVLTTEQALKAYRTLVAKVADGVAVAEDEAAEVDRFKALEAEHDQRVESLEAMIRQADERIGQAEAAGRSLIVGATDPDVLAERDALEAKRDALEAESVATRQQIGHLESALSVNLRQSEEFAGKEPSDAVRQQKQKLKALQDRLRELNTETVAADAAVRTFERTRLTDPAA